MNKKIKTLIIAGGTGGHVFPGYNLALHLEKTNFEIEIITDKRGFLFLKKFRNFKITILPSSPMQTKNLYSIVNSLAINFYSIIRSLILLLIHRPKIIFGMGGYASFPICIAAAILRIEFIIYENNLIIGKSNKYLLPFAKKILVSFKELEGIPKKYNNKVYEIGNIIKKEIINLSRDNIQNKKIEKLSILVLGGSQAAKIFAEILPNIFKQCLLNGIPIKVYQHCLPEQTEYLNSFYKNENIDFEIFNFSDNLNDFFKKTNLAITRSGSSILAELTNANVPFISIPLPSSAYNHQLKNALYYKKRNFSFLVEEKDCEKKLFYLIKEIYENKTLLETIRLQQSQFSDKNVYKNLDDIINKSIL